MTVLKRDISVLKPIKEIFGEVALQQRERMLQWVEHEYED